VTIWESRLLYVFTFVFAIETSQIQKLNVRRYLAARKLGAVPTVQYHFAWYCT
jgi:hypothetical protein